MRDKTTPTSRVERVVARLTRDKPLSGERVYEVALLMARKASGAWWDTTMRRTGYKTARHIPGDVFRHGRSLFTKARADASIAMNEAERARAAFTRLDDNSRRLQAIEGMRKLRKEEWKEEDAAVECLRLIEQLKGIFDGNRKT